MSSAHNEVIGKILYRLVRRIRWRVALPVVLVSACLLFVATALSVETVSFTVQKKNEYMFRHKDTQALRTLFWYFDRRSNQMPVVYTDDEIFEVTSSYVFFKFDSSERYQALEPGRRYRAVVTGWHIPTLGLYRNVVEILD